MSTILLALNAHDRLQLATTIERLINLLDDLERDPDLEPDADGEPTLGFPDAHGRGAQPLDPRIALSDIELDDCDDEDGGDYEPNGDEADFDGGEDDMPGLIRGGQGA